MKFNRFNVGMLPKKTKYNQFYDIDVERSLEFDERFFGINFLLRFNKVKDAFYKDEGRFIWHSCGNDSSRLKLFPMFAGIFGGIAVSSFTAWWIVFGNEPYPTPMLLTLVIWNIIFVNLSNVFANKFPSKLMYFDRVTSKVGFLNDIKGCEERDEFGHCCFPWKDIICSVKTTITNTNGSYTFYPSVVHKLGREYPDTRVDLVVTDSSQHPIHCILAWERIVRHMDNTKPLPDVPVYEAYRHLDPVTAEFDKQNNRPEYYWRTMSVDQQVEIGEELVKEAWEYDWSEKSEPKAEITQPWLRWTPDLTRTDKLDWKYKLKRITLQLLFCFP